MKNIEEKKRAELQKKQVYDKKIALYNEKRKKQQGGTKDQKAIKAKNDAIDAELDEYINEAKKEIKFKKAVSELEKALS